MYDQRAEREEEGEKRRVDGERRKKRQEEKRKREEKRRRRNGVRMEEGDGGSPIPRENGRKKRMAEGKQECPFFHTWGTHVSFN